MGTVTHHEPGEAGLIVANYDYLDEARALNKGTVRNFYAVISDPKRAAEMSDTIDRVFANSSNETKTASFRENAQQQLRSIGDLNFLIRAVIGAVLVALSVLHHHHDDADDSRANSGAGGAEDPGVQRSLDFSDGCR